MHLGVDSPLVALFRSGNVPRDVRMLAARGLVTAEAHDRLALLALLSADRDEGVASLAQATLDALPGAALEVFLARADVPPAMRAWYEWRISPTRVPGEQASPDAQERRLATREVMEDDVAATDADPAVAEAIAAAPDDDEGVQRLLTSLPVPEKIKLATLGRREQRAILIRDPNRIVATAVLGSPKLTETEIENFARMQNVSDEVLRIIGTSRAWTKNYAVVAALVKNPRTPTAVSLPLVPRLQERDVKGLTVNRNIPESVRLTARKFLQVQQERRG